MDDKIFKAFDIISDEMKEVLNADTYKRSEAKKEETQVYADFKTTTMAYRLMYNEEDQLFSLSSADILDDNGVEVYDEWKVLNKWLFDPATGDNKDAKDIGKDFCSTLSTLVKKKTTKPAKKRKKSADGADPIFLLNRFATVFPKLKEDMQIEYSEYDEFRPVTFTREKVVPEVNRILDKKDKSKLKKIGTVMSDVYSGGTLDTQGLITYVILNSIKEENVALMSEYLSDELKVSMKFSRKLIGKDIKPEKPKKQKKSFMADTLQDAK